MWTEARFENWLAALIILLAQVSTVAGYHVQQEVRYHLRHPTAARLHRYQHPSILPYVSPGGSNIWQRLGWQRTIGANTVVRSPSARVRIPINRQFGEILPIDEAEPMWDYSLKKGPEYWASKFPVCSGTRQSPVNIQTYQAQSRKLEGAKTVRFLESVTEFTIVYDGAAATLTPKGIIHLTGIGFSGETYTLANIHLHWSSSSNQGSEHAINGVRYPLEMHMVTYRTKYGSKSVAKTMKDGLAVLAILFKIGEINTALQPCLNASSEIERTGDEIPVKGLDLLELLPHTHPSYFRYHGSLTTPPCTENVEWTIYQQVQTLSSQQLLVLQDLRSRTVVAGEQMTDNFRPLQPFNGRIIESYEG